MESVWEVWCVSGECVGGVVREWSVGGVVCE